MMFKRCSKMKLTQWLRQKKSTHVQQHLILPHREPTLYFGTRYLRYRIKSEGTFFVWVQETGFETMSNMLVFTRWRFQMLNRWPFNKQTWIIHCGNIYTIIYIIPSLIRIIMVYSFYSALYEEMSRNVHNLLLNWNVLV